MRSLVMVLAAIVSLVQLGTVPAFAAGAAGPVVPVALIAAWGIARSPAEAYPAIPVTALILGLGSQERVGWFLVALLPLVLCMLLAARPTGATPRLVRAAAAAAAGAACYLAVLFLVEGGRRGLSEGSASLPVAAAATGLCAAAFAAMLWPFRSSAGWLIR